MSDTLWTTEQLAEWLGVHPKTLTRYRRAGMPYHQAGPKIVRYDVDEVRAWLERHRPVGATR